MRTSKFVNELKRSGIGIRKNRGEDIISSSGWYGSSPFSAVHLKDRGKNVEALIARLASTTSDVAAGTMELLSQPLPHAKSAIKHHRLVCSAYDRFAIYARGRKEDNELIVAHVAFAFECADDFDPFWLTTNSKPCQFTIRLLDMLVCELPNLPAAVETIPDVLAHLAMEHLNCGPVSAVRNLESDNECLEGLPLRIAIEYSPKVQRTLEINAAEELATALRNALDPDQNDAYFEAAELFELAAPHQIPIGKGGEAFTHALDIARLGRKAFEKPPRERPPPNQNHCLLIRDDPMLYLKAGRVINPQRLAVMQANATVKIEDDRGSIDWDAVAERRDVFDRRLETIRADAAADRTTERLTWLFLVDVGTSVFVARPISESDLSIPTVQTFLTDAWRGELGLLRNRPTRMTIAEAYVSGRTRDAIQSWLSEQGVALTAPSSGFDTPIHLAKNWCERSRDYSRNWDVESPAVASLEFLAHWAFAHTLTAHAQSVLGYPDTFAYNCGGYCSIRSVRADVYAQAIGIGDIRSALDSWLRRCDKRFRES